MVTQFLEYGNLAYRCGWKCGSRLHVLGIKASYTQSYAMESMSQGIDPVAFLVPGAAGVQEGISGGGGACWGFQLIPH